MCTFSTGSQLIAPAGVDNGNMYTYLCIIIIALDGETYVVRIAEWNKANAKNKFSFSSIVQMRMRCHYVIKYCKCQESGVSVGSSLFLSCAIALNSETDEILFSFAGTSFNQSKNRFNPRLGLMIASPWMEYG